MYVIGGLTQPIEIMSGHGWHLSNIGPDQGSMVVPKDVFYRAARKAQRSIVVEEESVEVDGFKIEERLIYVKSGRPVPADRLLSKRSKKQLAETMFAIKLSYGDKYVYMYRVTWDYICRSAVAQQNWERQEERESQDIVTKIGRLARRKKSG